MKAKFLIVMELGIVFHDSSLVEVLCKKTPNMNCGEP